MKEISEADVTGYYAHLMQRFGKGGIGNSGNTLWDHFQVFKQFVSSAAGGKEREEKGVGTMEEQNGIRKTKDVLVWKLLSNWSSLFTRRVTTEL
jgi:hypothetical protein